MSIALKEKFNKINSIFKLFCYLLAISLPIYYWFPMLYAKWGLIDDHEIFSLIGPNRYLPFAQILDALSTTEVSASSTLPRFRPTYYILRILESVAWGKDPSLWYGFRIFTSVFFGITLAQLSRLGRLLFTETYFCKTN